MAEVEIELPMKIIDGYGPGATDEAIWFTEKNLRVTFPKEFIMCIKQCDSGAPESSIFEFINPISGKNEKMEVSSFLSFDPCNEYRAPLKTYEALSRYDKIPEKNIWRLINEESLPLLETATRS